MGIFFFQAEDGIRDLTVTGVQTCALPFFFQAEAGIGDLTVTGVQTCALPLPIDRGLTGGAHAFLPISGRRWAPAVRPLSMARAQWSKRGADSAETRGCP